MGVSHGALFRPFLSREALWEEAVRWATVGLVGAFEAVDRADLPAKGGTQGRPHQHHDAEHPLGHGLLRLGDGLKQDRLTLGQQPSAQHTLGNPSQDQRRQAGAASAWRMRARAAAALCRSTPTRLWLARAGKAVA